MDARHRGIRRARVGGAALLFSAWLLAALASLALGAQSDAVESLQRFFAQVERYSARFDQVVLDELGEPIQESEGRLWIERPNRFRWDYQTPYEQQIVSDGEYLWVYDKDLQQVTVRPFEGGLLNTPAALLAGRGRLEDQFNIEDLGVADGLAWVALTPKQKDSGFESVRIGFEHGRLRRLEIKDSLGQSTHYTLSDAAENPGIAARVFAFEPPPDVDIVGEPPKER